jgi:ABC-type sugar transport system ATPase subunit
MTSPTLRLSDISKTYGAIVALDSVSLSVAKGSIHGLVGENGAGKSTLGKAVGGIVRPDSGEIEINGERVELNSPRDAIARGIGVMGQELALVPAMTVVENVYLGVERKYRGQRHARERDYKALTERVGFHPSANAKVGTLSIAQQQQVQILRALAREATILIMDEPTSSQHREELRGLHDLFRDLRGDGLSIIYVSHFLEDVVELADEVTVLRNGRVVDHLDYGDATPARLLKSMLGQELDVVFPPRSGRVRGKDRPPALEIRGLTRKPSFSDIDLQVQPGEVVGLAGLVGSGRTELARSVFGVDAYDAGEVVVCGQTLRPGSARAAIVAGVALVPEDRTTQGLLRNLTQEENISLPHLASISRAGVVRRGVEAERTLQRATQTGVTPMRLHTAPTTLSGGNQQKVLLAKWLFGAPKVLILDEPTRGVDVGAKAAIYELIAELADQRDLAVLLISSELEEIVALADRVAVLHQGRLAAAFCGAEITAENIMHASFGYDASEDTD